LSNSSAKIGLLMDSCGVCYAENISCVGMLDHGIVLTNNSFLCEINSCKIGGTGKSGILIKNLDKGGRGGDWVPSLVTNCIVYACGKGIETNRSLVVNITDCQVYQTKSHGFHVHSRSNSVLISGCRTFQVTGKAVYVDDSHEINISSNIFCWHTEEGIVLNNVIWGTVTGNNVIDNGSINLFDPDEDIFIKAHPERPHIKNPKANQEIPVYNGIYLKNGTKGVTVTGNAIFNWPAVPPMKYGIEEDETCLSNNISSNNINYCKEGGISSKGKETVVEANRSYIEQPYLGKGIKKYHYFDTRLMEEFISEINK
ncbi:MAG: right-handed parallel beta-helix repeat-containing protein, partial [bacterium]